MFVQILVLYLPMLNKDILEKRKEIGNMLFKLRTSAGISKRQMSIHAGIVRHIIDSMEGGASAYTIDSYIKYQDAIERMGIQNMPTVKFHKSLLD